MRSYEAARTYFSILEILSWCVIAAGGIVAVVAMAALEEMSRGFGGSSIAGLAGIVPGLGLMFSGFIGLVLTQIGRAGVDSAEYSQQMLKIARDQLEVSRQALRGPNAPANSFADAVEAAPGATSGYEGLSARDGETGATKAEIPAIEKAEDTEIRSGHEIEKADDVWRVGDQEFKSLETAKLYVATLSTEGAKETEDVLEWKGETRRK
ncbi:hypothetical protein [Sinisalibacter lacisalsi]|uniref:Uncharacterized protein n=1 Tax=Sinisalibacter lacisalsi TaxID=1526570 RepID=A0ABQ1QM56_9RHOB|nr:hypothetical protein [Sinisalibacter lacisalsi]GGD35189.1 hypothetical protein GCM10011358_18950 [Sinisalibacter lacisalsi]